MANTIVTRCCIAGGGPAGMMLGLLLARAGVDVVVLEKHGDFLRDFRGDTVHPSTLELMHELGLLPAFLQRPHDEAREIGVTLAGREWELADFSRLRTQCKFVALMPQWDFLDFVRDHAETFSGFHLMQNAEVTGLIEQDDCVTGVHVQTADGPLEVHADLVIGADGRHSTVRKAAGLAVRDLGAPIDVLWMRLPVAAGDTSTTGGRVGPGQFFVTLHRGSYWQCAYVIPKGGIDVLHAQGLPAFRNTLAQIAPMFADRVELLQSWDDIKLLSVSVDRLERWWKPGLLCIGDAAHAMSPIGGVGINLAIQDAVAAANILAAALAYPAYDRNALTPLLAQVQRRRLFPARVTQAAQVAIQNRVLTPLIGNGRKPIEAPWVLKLMQHWPILRALPAYAVGIGVRPEHIRSPRAG
ncbi:FAD-dependent oxidoreductase [Oxalicibacterium solurbis]|uniref:Monooxygenase n=1 Tax=Oxalicibacterium solurbis TaxID=69280 RepID=A0A8J3B082_9BURK|nr:FAD-dependent oxidoreductase [Oxalicibacterium solurbis]GGI54252.1 monooxygenase [Oxalicibacterium solurbis]